jgi:hypothetical protein
MGPVTRKVAKRTARLIRKNEQFFPRSAYETDEEHAAALSRARAGFLNIAASYYHLNRAKLEEAVAAFERAAE